MKLERINPDFIWNVDEKPLMPDFIKGSYTVDGHHIPKVSSTRNPSWTLLFWLSASGNTIPPLCIFPPNASSQIAEIQAMLAQQHTGFRTAIEPNGYMNSQTWENELYFTLPLIRKKMKMAAHQCGLLIFDNHRSHISHRVQSICRWFGFHALTIPSHLSMTVQPLDNYFNLSFQKKYQHLYAEEFSSSLQKMEQISFKTKLQCVVGAFRHTSNETELNRNSWKVCGMYSGFPDPQFKPKRFDAGRPFRGDTMPNVTKGFLDLIFSPENLIARSGYIIDREILKKLESSIEQSTEAQKSAEELVRLLDSSGDPQSPTAITLQKIGTHFFPKVQKSTTNFLFHLYQLSLTSPERGNSLAPPEVYSTEVIKAANKRLGLMMGQGMVMTCEVASQTLQIIEHEVQRKKILSEDREKHALGQKPIWLSLLSKLIELEKLDNTTNLDKKGTLSNDLLKKACEKLNLSRSGKKVDLANRLLEKVGIAGTITEYVEGLPQESQIEDISSEYDHILE